MNPFEVERLDFEEFQGIPIRADDELPTGRFRLVCSGQMVDKHPVADRGAAEAVIAALENRSYWIFDQEAGETVGIGELP